MTRADMLALADRVEREERSRDLVERAAFRAVQLYASAHPRPTQVTQQQAAQMLGVSAKTVQRYIRAGTLKLNRCGQVPIELVDALRAPQ